MSDVAKVCITGPLAVWRDGLTEELLRLGYLPAVAAGHLQLLAHISRWMDDHEVSVEDLSWPLINRFCSDRGLICKQRFAPRSVMVMMSLLRPDCRPVKACAPGGALSPDVELLFRDFAAYLRGERSLAASTVDGYLRNVRLFASWLLEHGGPDFTAVTISDVNQFLIGRAESLSVASAHAAAIVLRALFDWLFLIGCVKWDLADGIVSARSHWHQSMPKALPAGDVQSLLAATMSVRDRAIVLLLARLALRAGEVAGLTLDDFDWRAGTVRIRGKGNDTQLMPVSNDVGEAIAEYLSGHRRSGLPYRQVFLTMRAPYEPLSASDVSAAVAGRARRAGIVGRVGAHRLRHSAATAVLAGGGTLAEAGQLLRHHSAQVTAVYAKTDQGALRQITRSWSGSVCEEGAHE